MDAPTKTVDTGTAYGMKPGQHDAELTEVGPGTPMGELLRRYWHPVATSEQINSELPMRLRILGEDLVAFRDKSGVPGLLAEHCCHRGTSLFYGRIEDDGLRCCYHGWKFAPEGHCLDQACELNGGNRTGAVRQPWYPLQERYGLVFAYMGPPEKKPVLPRWAALEPLEEGEFYEHSLNPGYGEGEILDFNWLQSFENPMDPLHVAWLHMEHSEEVQFGEKRFIKNPAQISSAINQISWDNTELGVRYRRSSPLPGTESKAHFTVECILPSVLSVPNYVDQMNIGARQDQVGWHVPVDDYNFKLIQVARVREKGGLTNRVALHKGKRWEDCTAEELQRWPGDYEAQATQAAQGAIPAHNHEHLVMSDRGVVMLRRRLREQIRLVAEGKDPINISYDEDAAPLATVAGLTKD